MLDALRRWCVQGLTVVVCLTGARVAAADTKKYKPPAAKGDIYVVFEYLQNVAGTAAPTEVTVQWGSRKYNKKVAPPLKGCVTDFGQGFVLKMAHTKADSVEMVVTSTGKIRHEIKQDVVPREWNARCWTPLTW
jgi:hypothetical protein